MPPVEAFNELSPEAQEKLLKTIIKKQEKLVAAQQADPTLIEKPPVEYDPPKPAQEYKPLEFLHAAEMLAFFDENIQNSLVKLHPWQVETLIFLSRQDFSKQEPLKFALVAANGSGKDAYINAPIALFKLIARVRSRTIITSSSGTQLRLQTEAYIISLAERINKKLREQGISEKFINIKKTPVTHLTCESTGSEIVLFTTDETGRAEGWHPFPDNPNGEVTLIINEAKTVEDFIFDAFGRCTYTTFLEISSPGPTNGKFYFNCVKANFYPKDYIRNERYARRISSYDCTHISRQKIEQDKLDWGEASFLFRSRHLAEFTAINDTLIIPPDVLLKCIEKEVKKVALGLGRHAGVDLGGLASRGGDENTIYVFDENIYVGHKAFYCSDANELVAVLETTFFSFGLTKESIINIDDGKIGKAIIDNLRNRGWSNVNQICNQSAAYNKAAYLNRGAELYFTFKRLVEECVVKLPKKDENEKLFYQLSSRKFSGSGHQGKIFLQDKKEVRATGAGSPDHSDAVVLAFAGTSIQDFKAAGVVTELAASGIVTMQEIAKQTVLPEAVKFYLKQRERQDSRKYYGFNPGGILRSLYGR